MKLVTIMPNYNHAHYLTRSLCAILNQERQPDELVFIDDGSTDNSLEVATSLLGNWPHAKIIRGGKNQGVIPRVNQGMAMTDSDYIHFASANDQVQPGFYEKSLALLAQYPTAALCCTIDEWEEPNGGLHWRVGQRMSDHACYLSPSDLVKLGQQDRLQVSSPSCILRRQAIHDVGGFVQAHEWNCDWFTYHAAAFRYGICFIPEPLSHFTLSRASYSSNMSNRARQRPVFDALVCDLDRLPFFAQAVVESHQLALFGGIMDLLRLGHRAYLTPGFVLRRLKVIALRKGRAWLPKPIGQLCLNLCKQ